MFISKSQLRDITREIDDLKWEVKRLKEYRWDSARNHAVLLEHLGLEHQRYTVTKLVPTKEKTNES
jgi:hypothetical protein